MLLVQETHKSKMSKKCSFDVSDACLKISQNHQEHCLCIMATTLKKLCGFFLMGQVVHNSPPDLWHS